MSECSQGQNKQQKCTSISSNSECRGEESGEGQYDRSREGKVEVNVAMAISCLISISLSISLHNTWENYTHMQPSQHTLHMEKLFTRLWAAVQQIIHSTSRKDWGGGSPKKCHHFFTRMTSQIRLTFFCRTQKIF